MKDGLGLFPLLFTVTALVSAPFFGNWVMFFAAMGLALAVIFARRAKSPSGPNIKLGAVLALFLIGLFLFGAWPELGRVSGFLFGVGVLQTTPSLIRLCLDFVLLATGSAALLSLALRIMHRGENNS